MTEEEAKTKWCPFARVIVHRSDNEGDGRDCSLVANRGYSVIKSQLSFCIGAHCMAWRWFSEHDSVTAGLGGGDGKHGYCGLAGKP